MRATAADAAASGLETRVLLSLTAGVAPASIQATVDALRAGGVKLTGAPLSVD